MKRIIQAAIRLSDGEVLTLDRPARHPSIILLAQKLNKSLIDSVQGFIYAHAYRESGYFCDRSEGYEIAKGAGQLLFPGPEYPEWYTARPGTLYTEDLW